MHSFGLKDSARNLLVLLDTYWYSYLSINDRLKCYGVSSNKWDWLIIKYRRVIYLISHLLKNSPEVACIAAVLRYSRYDECKWRKKEMKVTSETSSDLNLKEITTIFPLYALKFPNEETNFWKLVHYYFSNWKWGHLSRESICWEGPFTEQSFIKRQLYRGS